MTIKASHKGRARVSDYERLDSQLLKATAHLPVGESLTTEYLTSQGKKPLVCKREEEDIFIHWGKHCWRIHLRPFHLNFGVRYWFGCPCCGRRCSFLYITGHKLPLACRECVKPAYTCQNSTELQYTYEKSLSLRQRLWSTSDLPELEDLSEECTTFELHKPKGKWWKTFRRDFVKLEAMEQRWQTSLLAKYKKALIVNP